MAARDAWTNLRRRRVPTYVILVFATLVSGGASSPLFAQDYRATLTGRVYDVDGGALPTADVSLTSLSTGIVQSRVIGEDGTYAFPFLPPGRYRVSVTLPGFRQYQAELELELSQVRVLDITLTLAAGKEIVDVSGAGDVLDLTGATRGLRLNGEQVDAIPLIGGNPWMLAWLAPGVTYIGQSAFQRPFDQGAIADFSINGGPNRNNEFLIDGIPNNAIQNGNNIAYVPPVDAVNGFRVLTNAYDAQFGRTGGGVISLELKSGGNQFQGSVYEFARRKAFDARDYQTKVRGGDKPDHRLDQYGLQVGGPVRLPRYDGRNRLFFMFGYERYRELTPNAMTFTVPDEAQLSGDFSNLKDRSGNPITIYDPKTGHQDETGTWIREPFPGNRIPADRIDEVAAALREYFLRPNLIPPSDQPSWRDNYIAAPNHAHDDFNNLITKVDVNISDETRLFVRYGYSRRTETRYTNGITSGPAQDGQLPLWRINHSAAADVVRQVGTSFLMNVRGGFTNYREYARSDPGLEFDPASLKFSDELLAHLPNRTFPRLNFFERASTSNTGTNEYQPLGRPGRSDEVSRILSVHPNVVWMIGRQMLRFGGDIRFTSYTRDVNANLFVLSFDRRFTQRSTGTNDGSGNSLASFLLGAPSAGAIDSNFIPVLHWRYYAPWIQHDWRLTNRLTINLGLRWDLASPVFEAHNQLNAGFDTTTPVQLPAAEGRPSYTVTGGLLFVQPDASRYPSRFDANNIQPRLGVAYVLGEHTVVRGGYGQYYLNVTSLSASNGFAVQTVPITSTDGDRTPAGSLANPFSEGIRQAPGSSQGLQTLLGSAVSFSNPDFVNPVAHHFSAGIQQRLPLRMTLDAAYSGSRTRQLQNRWGGFNEPPAALRDQCDESKGGKPAICDELRPNPFYGVSGFEGTARYTSPTLTRYEMSRPFPQFGEITMLDRNDGRIWYDSLQLMLSGRSSSLAVTGAYTWAKALEENGGGNQIGGTAVQNPLIVEADRIVQRSPPETDRRHRVAISAVYTVPFLSGRSRQDTQALLHLLAAGWQVSGVYIFNTGRPWGLPQNAYYLGNGAVDPIEYSDTSIRAVRPCVARLKSSTIELDQSAIDAGCTEPSFIIRPKYSAGTASFRDDRIRRPYLSQLDMSVSKTTPLGSTLRLQLRIDVFNLLNQPMYDERQYTNSTGDSSFGAINRVLNRQTNVARTGQLGISLLF